MSLTPEEMIALEDAAAPGGFSLFFPWKVHQDCIEFGISICGQESCEFPEPERSP